MQFSLKNAKGREKSPTWHTYYHMQCERRQQAIFRKSLEAKIFYMRSNCKQLRDRVTVLSFVFPHILFGVLCCYTGASRKERNGRTWPTFICENKSLINLLTKGLKCVLSWITSTRLYTRRLLTKQKKVQNALMPLTVLVTLPPLFFTIPLRC